MLPIQRALRTVRAATALAPARPAYAAGIRAAIATVAPLVLAGRLPGDAGTWTSIGGFNGALSDRGGPYRTRAATMGILAVSCAGAILLGALGFGRPVVAVALTFVVALVASLGRTFGDAGAAVGGATLSTFVIALAMPYARLFDALPRAGFAVVGVLWAMTLALVLWPLRPYRPARVAIANAYRVFASHVFDVVDQTGRTPGGEGSLEPPAGSAAVRAALEQLRVTLARMRRGRSGRTGRGERLLVLGEAVDQLFGHVVALGETVATIPGDACDAAAQTEFAATLREIGHTAREIAAAVEEERDSRTIAVEWSGEALRGRVAALVRAGQSPRDAAPAHYAQAAALVDRAAQYARVAAANVAALNDGRAKAPPSPAPPDSSEEIDEGPRPLAMLRAVLTPDSVILRHALRVAVVTSLAVGLTEGLGIRRGYWVTITTVVILQPYAGATTNRALQRVLGTVLGGVLTAALGAIFHDPRAILVLAFLFAALCVALMPLNYAAFSVFLTPTFVLLAEASAGDWHLAGVRVVNTLLGGALALAGGHLLWPSPEWRRLPSYMAAALRANRDYLRCVVSLYGDRSEEAGRTIRAARRRAGLASVNAEESFQRLLGEHPGDSEELSSVMTFLAYTRRFSASAAALALSRHAQDAPPPSALEPFASDAERVFDDLIAALGDGRRPLALPPIPATEEVEEAPEADLPPLLRARVERLRRQLGMLHDAVDRWTLHAGGPDRASGATDSVPAARVPA